MELRPAALEALCIAEPRAKCEAVHRLWARRDRLAMKEGALAQELPEPCGVPGRPALPRLVPPGAVPQRSPFTRQGRAALLHAIAHIEFNAINLALDAVWRFPGLPPAYYLDWLRVADEEATHHRLVVDHLATLGHAYGDFEAHDGLWAMAMKTRSDFTARMALVPRTLEARGLDVTPGIQAKLTKAGDLAAVAVLDIILRDEVGHVAIGNHWYRWACDRDGRDPIAAYAELAALYAAPRLKPPFNREARRRAGFTAAEMDWLDGLECHPAECGPAHFSAAPPPGDTR